MLRHITFSTTIFFSVRKRKMVWKTTTTFAQARPPAANYSGAIIITTKVFIHVLAEIAVEKKTTSLLCHHAHTFIPIDLFFVTF